MPRLRTPKRRPGPPSDPAVIAAKRAELVRRLTGLHWMLRVKASAHAAGLPSGDHPSFAAASRALIRAGARPPGGLAPDCYPDDAAPPDL